MLCSTTGTTTHSSPPPQPKPLQSPLSLLPQCRSLSDLKQIHAQTIKSGLHRSRPSAAKLMESAALSPFADLPYAHHLFASSPQPDHFMWNTLIRAHSLTPTPLLAVRFFVRMLLSGTPPNPHTFPFLLKSCASGTAPREGAQIHAHLLKLGLRSDPFVHASLVDMYARCGLLSHARRALDASPRSNVVASTALINGYFLWGRPDDASRLFDGTTVKDVVSWNAMISGYSRCGRPFEALGLFREMVEEADVEPDDSTLVTVLSACAQSGSIGVGKFVDSYIKDHGFGPNLRLGNALVDMYAKCGDLDRARSLFDGLARKDRISWNIMIGGYAYSRRYKEALALFREMQSSREEPNEVTFLNVLPAVAQMGALDIGKWIHAYVDKKVKHGYTFNTSLYTSLIDMYCKCGSIESAEQVFVGMETVSVSSWNAMISGLAMHGRSDKAFECFERMPEEGLEPDEITFVGILSACSRAGLVAAGKEYFRSMVRDHNISPRLEHYGCMVDLLGRAGRFEEAIDLIKKMEVDPDGAIWGTLLGACQVQGNAEFAEYVANNLLEMEVDNPGNYVLLSNIYAKSGRWEDVARIRTSLNDKGLKKEPGCSSIEVDSVVHEFLVGDTSHPRSREIYVMLEEMDKKLELAGHVPDTSEVLYDMEEEWKRGVLCYHSEKLAIAFGLISTTPGTTIRIVKNLRVCGNCHSATKLISKIYDREIIARDRSRFHHFKGGVCSCNDYW